MLHFFSPKQKNYHLHYCKGRTAFEEKELNDFLIWEKEHRLRNSDLLDLEQQHENEQTRVYLGYPAQEKEDNEGKPWKVHARPEP